MKRFNPSFVTDKFLECLEFEMFTSLFKYTFWKRTKGASFFGDCNRENSPLPGLIQSKLKTPYFVKIELCVFLCYFLLHVIFYIYIFDECFNCNLVQLLLW